MIFVLLRRLHTLLRMEWIRTLALLVLLIIMVMVVMPLVEGPESPLGSAAACWWWFVVTVTTVGYGDLVPATLAGRILAFVVMVVGIGLVALVLGNAATALISLRRRKMKGLTQLSVRHHVVVFGYRGEETDQLIEELLADRLTNNKQIVLCSNAVEENPMPDRILFVRGEPHSDDALQRCCARDADYFVIHGRGDDETIFIALAVNAVRSGGRVVAYVNKPETTKHLMRINSGISVVEPIGIPVVVQEMQDKGVTSVLHELLSNRFGNTIYRVDIPPEVDQHWPFAHLVTAFKKAHGAILLGVIRDVSGQDRTVINPESQFSVTGGMGLFMIAPQRPTQVRWQDL